MAVPILEANDLHKSFDKTQAVNGISFEIMPGEIFSLLGPNGAGKTTTISMLSCLLIPTQGDARVDGHSVRQEASLVKRAIGVVPQEIALYPDLSARENLAFWGSMYSMRGAHLQERIAAVLEIVGLSERAKEKVETYSGGMKRRINIAVGLLHQPKILFMDEPTVGIDPQSRRRILDTVMDLNRQGLTVLYTTHNMEEASELSDRIGIIDHGKLIAVGTQAELTQTVGAFDTLHVGIEADVVDTEQLLKAITAARGVHRATLEDGSIVIQAEDANATLGAVVTCLDQVGAKLVSLRVDEPNLEAVFLHHTGRALRD